MMPAFTIRKVNQKSLPWEGQENNEKFFASTGQVQKIWPQRPYSSEKLGKWWGLKQVIFYPNCHTRGPFFFALALQLSSWIGYNCTPRNNPNLYMFTIHLLQYQKGKIKHRLPSFTPSCIKSMSFGCLQKSCFCWPFSSHPPDWSDIKLSLTDTDWEQKHFGNFYPIYRYINISAIGYYADTLSYECNSFSHKFFTEPRYSW